MGFTKPKKAIGLDIGTHAVKAVQMSRSSGRLRVDYSACALVDRNQLNADPIVAQTMAVREALEGMAVSQSRVVSALTGQMVVVRYPRLTDVPRDQLSAAVAREAANNIPYDLDDVFMDWVVLDEYMEEERRQTKVLLVAAKHEVIGTRLQVLQSAEVECGILDVDSLALADAAEACDFLKTGETVAMINIGLTSSSVHFIKDGVSNFIREVNWGARELVQAVAKGRRCSYDDAIAMLEDINQNQERAEMPVALEAMETEFDAPSIEEEPPLASEPFAEISDMGGSLLDPLDEELDTVDDAVSETFESGPEPSPRPRKTQQRMDDVIAAPLNRMGIELRRSFDFYEHQLYERPVDRILLSGGPAALPHVAETLREELGFSVVEIANPVQSALLLGDERANRQLISHPAQFMVAIGLAARGMADL